MRKGVKTDVPEESYVLNEEKLLRGDIVLTTSKHKISNIVRLVTFGAYSHAFLVMGDGSYLEAGGPETRIKSDTVQRLFIDSPEQCVVLRLKKAATEEQMDEVINFARSKVGTEYSVEEAKRTIFRVSHPAIEAERQFCSRYVAQSYLKGGFKIVANPDYCSPQDILNSSLLAKVEDTLRRATVEEIKVLNESSQHIDAQGEADEYLLSKASSITGIDIQNHGVFNAAVIKYRELDTVFARLLHESGYLRLWEHEMADHPYFYNFELLQEEFPDSNYLRNKGKGWLASELEIRKRFVITLDTLERSFEKNERETLRLQVELYKKLLTLSETRESVFRAASLL